MEVADLRYQIFFVIHEDDHNLRLHVKFQPSITISFANAACTKFDVTKCRFVPPPLECAFFINLKSFET